MGVLGAAGSSVPPGDDWIKQELAALHRRLDDLASADILRTAGLETEPDLLRVVGSLETTGALDVDGPMNVGGDATFSGAMAIAGTLSLPAGIINNEALASPVSGGQASVSQTDFGTALTDQDFAAGTIAVPAGFTRALVIVVSTAGVVNSTGSPDFLYVSAGINGVKSREVFALAGAGSSTSISTAKSTLLTGLSGGSITVKTIIHTQGSPWGANGANRAYTESIVTFLR